MLESGERPAGIVTIGRNDNIKQAAAKMLAHKVGCLIVNDENGNFIGLVTERDIAHFIAESAENGDSATVDRIMAHQIISCAPGTPTSQVREIMARHRIRHLPIVDNGVVVGILSARDIMGRQLLEDRAAAEEVAMLSNCLKSIDLSEAVEIAAAEVPKLFGAFNCILCLYPSGQEGQTPELLSSNRCPCLGGHMDEAVTILQQSIEGGYCTDGISPECESCGGKPPRVVIPLEIIGLKEPGIDKEKRLSGYLCMCGLDPAIASNRELISYKAKLTREILTAHLTNATRYQQARLSSLTDALTGVGSRKLLEDKDIDENIEELRARYAVYNTVEDGEAQEGDQVIIDFEGTVDGVAFAGVAKYPARVKCALLGWMAFKDAVSQAVADAPESRIREEELT